ncbi:MAG: NADAR family protein [Cyanobacteria bacterium P01_H01_bin.121]
MIESVGQIRNTAELLIYLSSVQRVKYLFFWGHQPPRDGEIGKHCLSQWYTAPFELEGVQYATAEHYMMAEKARLFGDHDAEQAILKAKHPGEAKQLGRQVQGFNEPRWRQRRDAIVQQGNLAKFSQNPQLQTFLWQTGDRILVEASPRDRIWGIGLTADDPRAEQPSHWPGLNLLGFALMQVRQTLNAPTHS